MSAVIINLALYHFFTSSKITVFCALIYILPVDRYIDMIRSVIEIVHLALFVHHFYIADGSKMHE